MAKSPDAFRTISEVADWLGVEAHVLRFWESRFIQVKPVKRAGGRRYYRPSDMALLGGIRRLLHEDGMTIRGVQKILREQGVSHVAALSPELALDGVETSALPRRAAAGEPRAAQPAAPPAESPPAASPAAVEDDAPGLPFDLPPPSPAPHPTRSATDEVRTDMAQPDGAARRLVAVIGARRLRLDPAAAAPVLARARDLVARLRDVPW